MAARGIASASRTMRYGLSAYTMVTGLAFLTT
jgi:hypothetical protein